MFDGRSVLFASRRGFVLEDLGASLPPIEVVGFSTDPSGRGIDTLSLAPVGYSDKEIQVFRSLLRGLQRAVVARDKPLVGRVALGSARMNQRHLPKPRFLELEVLAQALGALGVQVAHSGTVVGFLFDPQDDRLDVKACQIDSFARAEGLGPTWRFRT
jgi:uncharacterized protein involved in propanediol utilization